MDRVRVLCPSISFGAHVAGATILVLASLSLPERLPRLREPPHGAIDWGSPRVSLGGNPLGGGGTRPVRQRERASTERLRVPVKVASTLELMPTLDLEGPPGIVGLPVGEPGPGTDGPGFCVFDCDPARIDPELGHEVQPNPSRPVRLRGGDLRAPVKVRHVAPEYPALALAARVQGSVVLDCVIDEDGRVSSVAVLSGHPLLDAAAVEAVQQWRYRPTLLNGVRMSVLLTVTVDFRLR